MKTFAIGL